MSCQGFFKSGNFCVNPAKFGNFCGCHRVDKNLCKGLTTCNERCKKIVKYGECKG